MPAHARAAAGGGGRPAGAGAGPGRARARAWAWARAWVRVRVPYPAWFFLNRVCGYGNPDPNQPACDCWVHPLGCQQTRLLCRKGATFGLGSNLLGTPGRLYKGLQILN